MRCYHVDRVEEPSHIAVLVPDDNPDEEREVPAGNLREGEKVCMNGDYDGLTYYGSEGYGFAIPDVVAQAEPTSGGDVVSYDAPEGTTGAYGDEESGAVAGPDVTTGGEVGSIDSYLGAALGGLGLGQLASTFKLGVGGQSGVNVEAQTGDNVIMPVPGPGGSGRTAAILAAVAKNIGKRISAKAIVRFIIKWGAAAAAGATGLGASDLLYLFFKEKSKPHRHRGPHLYTVVKRIRQGHRYEKMLTRYSSKAHVHRHAAGARRPTCMFCRRSPCTCRRRKHA